MSMKVALIGTGMAAKPHALALHDLKSSLNVTGVYSRTPARASAFCEEHGFLYRSSLDAVLTEGSPDFAIVVTPPDQRETIVKACIAAGVAVLMEKPVERTTAAATALVTLCEQHQVPLGIVFQHRYREASKTLMSWIKDNRLGQIHAVQVNVPWWRDQSYYDEPGRGTYARDGGGVLISQAIHTLDLLLALCGPVSRVHALSATTGFHRLEAEDFVAGALQFRDGAIGSLMATTAAWPGQAESIVLHTEQGTATLASGELRLQAMDGTVSVFGDSATTGGGSDPMAFPFAWHRDLIADFADCIQAGRSPTVTGRQALAVHHLIDALISSSNQQKASQPAE